MSPRPAVLVAVLLLSAAAGCSASGDGGESPLAGGGGAGGGTPTSGPFGDGQYAPPPAESGGTSGESSDDESPRPTEGGNDDDGGSSGGGLDGPQLEPGERPSAELISEFLQVEGFAGTTFDADDADCLADAVYDSDIESDVLVALADGDAGAYGQLAAYDDEITAIFADCDVDVG